MGKNGDDARGAGRLSHAPRARLSRPAAVHRPRRLVVAGALDADRLGAAAPARHLRRGAATPYAVAQQFGRASCRERVCQYVLISVVAGLLKKKKNNLESNFNLYIL